MHLGNKNSITVVVQSLSHVRLFGTPWTAARQTSLSFTISWGLLKHMSIDSVMPSNHLILCHHHPAAIKGMYVVGGIYYLHCSMWDLVPQPWIELRPPALGALSLSHWTISEVPEKASVVGLYVRWPLGKPWWGQCSLTCHTNQK